ncbi:MAG: NAD(+) diphosphatase [Synergistales bacterium]
MPPKPAENGKTFAFQGDRLIVRLNPVPCLPLLPEIPEAVPAEGLLLRLSQSRSPDRNWANLREGASLPEGMELVSLREVWKLLGEEAFVEAGRARQLMDWYGETNFCGRCGRRMADHETDGARTCESCGFTVYPTVSPAIIVAIERDGKLLLARGLNFPKGRYSVLAGFVEPGESLEEAVQREIFEEVSLRVKDIRYFGSQPWPFPHSLMMGFTAVWDSGEISIDPREIGEADWFAPEEFPEIPPSISISRKLIDDFILRHRRKESFPVRP